MLYYATFLGREEDGRTPVRLLLTIVADTDAECLTRALEAASTQDLTDVGGYEVRDMRGRVVSTGIRDVDSQERAAKG